MIALSTRRLESEVRNDIRRSSTNGADMAELRQLAGSVPTLGRNVPVDWAGVTEAARVAGFDPSSAATASWCRFGDRLNVTGSGAPDNGRDAVAFIFPSGILATVGKRTRRGIEAAAIPFARCRSLDTNHFEGVGFGHYMIHFVGPGGILLGYLYWTYDAPKRGLRFILTGNETGDRSAMMAAAEEYERILDAVKSIVEA
jgi:hypothetical protein